MSKRLATELASEQHNTIWEDNDELVKNFYKQLDKTIQSISDRNEALERITGYAR